MLLFSFSDKLTAKKQGRILKIYWFWISLIIFIKDTVLFKVFHQVNIIFVYNPNFFTKKHIIYNDKREEGEKIRWNSCQILTKKLKQCWFCFCMFFSTLEVLSSVHCVFRDIRSKGCNCEVLRLKETVNKQIPCCRALFQH